MNSVTGNTRAWSYSALNAFELCPKRYYDVSVQKRYKDQGEAMAYGMQVHSAFDLRLNRGHPFPLGMRQYEQYAKFAEDLPGQYQRTELKLGVTADYRPCEFFSSEVWCRCVVDFVKVNNDVAVVIDWKTGKKKHDIDQLALMAGVIFAHLSEVKKVVSLFVWLQENDYEKVTFTREQVPEIWGRFLERVRRFDEAFKAMDFAPRAGKLCRKYCPVISCPHHGR